jgi:hypothetical protein
LSTYFDYIHSLDEPLPVKRGLDFEFAWPHSWSPEGVPLIGLTQNFSWQYQTGATSSRHAHKARIRASASLLRSAEAAFATATASGLSNPEDAALFQTSWDALGVMQHHDSMPGTMRTTESVTCPDQMPMNALFNGMCTREQDPNRHVLTDYTLRLDEADNNTLSILSSSLEKLVGLESGALQQLNLEQRNSMEGNDVLVFNPTATPRDEILQMNFQRPSDVATTTLPTLSLLDGTTTTKVVAQIVVNDRLVTSNTVATPGHCAPPPFSDALYFIAQAVAAWGTKR